MRDVPVLPRVREEIEGASHRHHHLEQKINTRHCSSAIVSGDPFKSPIETGGFDMEEKLQEVMILLHLRIRARPQVDDEAGTASNLCPQCGTEYGGAFCGTYWHAGVAQSDSRCVCIRETFKPISELTISRIPTSAHENNRHEQVITEKCIALLGRTLQDVIAEWLAKLNNRDSCMIIDSQVHRNLIIIHILQTKRLNSNSTKYQNLPLLGHNLETNLKKEIRKLELINLLKLVFHRSLVRYNKLWYNRTTVRHSKKRGTIPLHLTHQFQAF
ncbi:hypothetical protein ACFX15_005800 [Malus domestica]